MFIIYFLSLLAFASSKRTFTVVIDTSGSMLGELDILKSNLEAAFVNVNTTDISNYALVSFNDYGVGAPSFYDSPKQLVDSFLKITVEGVSPECPENSLSAIERALEISDKDAVLLVITDANAKDEDRLDSVQNLCRNSGSQVNIFLAGTCPSHRSQPMGSVDVYYDVVTSCSGALLRLDVTNLKKGLQFVKEIIGNVWNEVTSMEPFTGYRQLSFSVDVFTSDFLVAISGESPVVQITDAAGQRPDVIKVVDTRSAVVLRMVNPKVAEYKVDIRCRGTTTATFYKKTVLPFDYGFSSKKPRNIRETTHRPLPGITNYLFIVVTEISFELTSTFVLFDNGNRIPITFEEVDETKRTYISSLLFEPEKPFKIHVQGKDLSAIYLSKDVSISTKIVEPQVAPDAAHIRWIKPVAEILPLEAYTIEYRDNATVVCRVLGFPRPLIWWEDDEGKKLQSEDTLLELPSLSISYLTLADFSDNVTVSCKCQNSEGEHSQSIQLYVNRPFSFEVVQAPFDLAIEFGQSGKLYCEVNAYPKATTTWYRNGTTAYTTNIEILSTENALEIKNMTLDDIGEYSCEAKNYVETRNLKAFVNVSGLEIPDVYLSKSEVMLKLQDSTEVECNITRGIPAPEIKWYFKARGSDEFGDVPFDVNIDGNKLKIKSVEIKHGGVYKCEGVNLIGKGSKEVALFVQIAPHISGESTESITVYEVDPVELSCEVEAVPEARVRWEMRRGEDVVPFDARHMTDEYHTHRFSAISEDSGTYYCIAENVIGKAEKVVSVNVLVEPYIEGPKFTTLTARRGSTVNIACVLKYGNPAPEISWEFLATASIRRKLSRIYTADNTLVLRNVTISNEGAYICRARNIVNSDSIKVDLRVQ